MFTFLSPKPKCAALSYNIKEVKRNVPLVATKPGFTWFGQTADWASPPSTCRPLGHEHGPAGFDSWGFSGFKT
jgi:hypothetical protein